MATGAPWREVGAGRRVLVAAAAGVVVGGTAGATSLSWQVGLLLGWMTAATVLDVWLWATIRSMDGPTTRRHARREDVGQATADLIILGAAVASLGAVGLFLAGGSSTAATDVMAVLSVALAWVTTHTVYATRYARLYYDDPEGGIDFNSHADPRYRDFVYLAFTVGMTFQVSDTAISRHEVRDAVTRQMLLSYVLGTVVIAATVNLVAGLAR